jgi:hypothetical protein
LPKNDIRTIKILHGEINSSPLSVPPQMVRAILVFVPTWAAFDARRSIFHAR